MRALVLHSPRTWVWKAGLFVAPVCLAIGLVWWLNPGIGFKAMMVGGFAASGIALALWALNGERSLTAERRDTEEAHSQFLAATEANLDAFSLLEAVRDSTGEIVDFRFLYVNANAERLSGLTRSEMLGETLCSVMMVNRQGRLFGRYCNVVNTGEPLKEELPVTRSNIKATWIRYQVIKLGDGLAITCSDISAAKATQEQYKHLAEFTDSVFQNAPFSIVATDTHGLITAMNVAAEKLTGYSRDELVGKAPLTILHDEKELAASAREFAAEATGSGDAEEREGFDVLTAGVVAGEMDEKEWTLVRRDGARTPINLAVRAVT